MKNPNIKLNRKKFIKLFDGTKLYQTECIKSFLSIKKGEIGGYIQSEDNLDDNAWVSGDAWVLGNGSISVNAWVSKNALVSEKMNISEDVMTYLIITDN